MRKSLIFIFFLFIFSRCEETGNLPLPVSTRTGAGSGMALNQGGLSVRTGSDSLDVVHRDFRPVDKRPKKRRATPVMRQPDPSSGFTTRQPDSLFIIRLQQLRKSGIYPDLNEAVTRDYLFSPAANHSFQSMIALSQETFLRVNFDNDIMDYTDRFYTNGIRIDVVAPVFQMNPVRKLMLPYRRQATNYYGLSIVQNMYTPSTTKLGGILYGDRPYAAYMYLGSFKITNDSARHFRQTSEIDAGIIGPNSYGEWVQRSFHNAVPTNNEPLGWQYQVQNDLVLNYTLSLEKGVVNGNNIDIVLGATGNAGTLYTNLSGGAMIRAGWLNPYFANLGVAKKKVLENTGMRKFQFFLFLKGSGKLVGYDATLQGGVFNKSSIYTLPGSEISRVVFQASGGLALSYNGIRVDLEQFMLSPEFKSGLWHKWVHVALTFCL